MAVTLGNQIFCLHCIHLRTRSLSEPARDERVLATAVHEPRTAEHVLPLCTFLSKDLLRRTMLRTMGQGFLLVAILSALMAWMFANRQSYPKQVCTTAVSLMIIRALFVYRYYAEHDSLRVAIVVWWVGGRTCYEQPDRWIVLLRSPTSTGTHLHDSQG